MGEKLSKAPVYFTIAQVRFNSVQKMDSYAPDIQEKFRKATYSDAQTITLNGLNFGIGVNDAPLQMPVPIRQTQNTYANFDKTECFILDQSSLTYQATKYRGFETFSETFLKGMEFVNDVVEGLDFVDRIGMRYLNAFEAQNTEHITEYLNPKVIGLFDDSQKQNSQSFSETVYKRNDKNVIARTIILSGRFNFPFDAQPGALAVNNRFKEISGVHSTLDIDSSTSTRQRFSINLVTDELKLIHDEIESAFKEIVSSKALEIWK